MSIHAAVSKALAATLLLTGASAIWAQAPSAPSVPDARATAPYASQASIQSAQVAQAEIERLVGNSNTQ
ncbi:MAG: hypothetical protein GAK30_03704 [Paracidovorax wautersii]|uniref:DUF4148 domain-containing protein n=1 Tax=Paracidovorax wautersii TaxID=1177982 RepID=A0A7V8FKR0_9BURK|nr:MAG: hypothetical protein GAK30_03704 [Paracidovorax wautersii]